MCTLSLHKEENKISVTMNRDERLDRQLERAPYQWSDGIIAPQDLQSGGTWIGFHPGCDRWACLLNGYSDFDSKGKTSRGRLVPYVLMQNDFKFEQDFDFSAYNSFRFLYGDLKEAYEVVWDGETLKQDSLDFEDDWVFRSSSSWRQDRVVTYRKKIFDRWKDSEEHRYITKASIPSFHLTQEKGEESSSVLMRRPNPERATVSITRIELEKEKQKITYFSSKEFNVEQTLQPLLLEDVTNENCQTLVA